MTLITLLNRFLRWFLVGLIRVYQKFISPFLPPSCRYTPTCSEYAVEAIRIHGIGCGIWLATGRILRCNPFFPGGSDEVPIPSNKKDRQDG